MSKVLKTENEELGTAPVSPVNEFIGLENLEVVHALKTAYAFDGGAEREHNASPEGLGFGLLHYSFVRNLQPDFALAIGSRYGFVPACIALALKANGKGRLHFVDANYDDRTDQFAKAYGGTGHWSRPIQELFGTLQLHEWIDLFVERTDAFFPKSTVQYGYIYIDGNHSYQGVAYDFSQAISHLAAGGLISVHDALVDQLNGAAPTDPGGFGIKQYPRRSF
jgi:predicted O-methyltransferase YrrM